MCDVEGFQNCRMNLLRHVSFVDCPVRGPGVVFNYAFSPC